MEKSVSDLLNDAKRIVDKLSSKTSSESTSQERMSEPQVPEEKEDSPNEIILDKTQPWTETDSPTQTNSDSPNKEDTTNISGISLESASEKEKILTEIQEEEQALEELKAIMDKYLPSFPDLANLEDFSNEEINGFAEDTSRKEGYYTSLGSLPSNLQPQAYKNAMEIIRGSKNNIRKLLYQLYEAIHLTYQSKRESEDQQNCRKALSELWIKWSTSRSQNLKDDAQFLEICILGMARILALKLQSAFTSLMPKIQSLPIGLQVKLQQSCYDMQELYYAFSISYGFDDLDKHYLTQSQLKLTQAQASLEELLCFLQDNFPPECPFSPSECPFFPSECPLPENNTP